MENKEISITMKTDVWNFVLNALAGRPYAEVAQVIAEMARQIEGQAPRAAMAPEVVTKTLDASDA